MKIPLSNLLTLLGVVALALPTSLPADEPPKPATEVKPGEALKVPQYKPRWRGAPSARVSGGTRTGGGGSVSLDVLAPDHVGLTLRERPSLFWFQSSPAKAPLELTLCEEKRITTDRLLEVKRAEAAGDGIQRVRLSEAASPLAIEEEYRWQVALIWDADSRSKDSYASGVIKRVEPSPALAARLKTASREELPFLYAEEGIWYDALEALSDLIEERPNDAALRRQRAELLTQVGLTDAAARDLQAAGAR